MAKLEAPAILERAETVLGAINDEWQTRDQIAFKCGVGRMAIQRTLTFLVNRRFVEFRLKPPVYGVIGCSLGSGLSLARRAYQYRLKLVRGIESEAG